MFCHETKALKETLNALVLKVSTMSDLKGPLKHQEEAVIHFIHVQEGPNPTLFGPLMNKTLLTFICSNLINLASKFDKITYMRDSASTTMFSLLCL
jgi:hypothetical protein